MSRAAPLLALLAAPLLLAARQAAPVTGAWLTQNGKAVVAVSPCGQGLCGRLVGLMLPRQGAVVRDVWGRSECGETILRMLTPGPNGHWHGTITDPRDGTRYNAEIWRSGAMLRLRGYVLVPALGATQTWRSFDGKIGPGCALTPTA